MCGVGGGRGRRTPQGICDFCGVVMPYAKIPSSLGGILLAMCLQDACKNGRGGENYRVNVLAGCLQCACKVKLFVI